MDEKKGSQRMKATLKNYLRLSLARLNFMNLNLQSVKTEN